MNKNQIGGSVEDVAGKVQQKVGEAIDDRDQQAKGLFKRIEGKIQKGVGDVQHAVADADADKEPSDKR
ncbi:MAG: CsbD family protein [Betaproteobacteria bacterium]